MTDNRKTTVPGASVGADAVQSSSKINTNIITNLDKQINLQAAKKSNNFGLNTVSMTELYDTVYPPRKPIVNDLLYSGTYLFVGAPKVGKSFFMGQLAYHVAMGLPLWHRQRPDAGLRLRRVQQIHRPERHRRNQIGRAHV